MRSRAVNRPLACWFSMALTPPPSQIFSPSLRTCDMRSARKRMLASKRAEVGSIFVVSTLAGCRRVRGRSFVTFSHGSRIKERTDYGIPRGLQRATRHDANSRLQRRLRRLLSEALRRFGHRIGSNGIDESYLSRPEWP